MAACSSTASSIGSGVLTRLAAGLVLMKVSYAAADHAPDVFAADDRALHLLGDVSRRPT